jgi:hypothetical protein
MRTEIAIETVQPTVFEKKKNIAGSVSCAVASSRKCNGPEAPVFRGVAFAARMSWPLRRWHS